MNREAFNRFCAGLPQTTHVVQWGDSDVWKIGGKVFAICGWGDGPVLGITFKTSEIAFEMLRDRPGLRPAPYFASRGMKWIQRHNLPGLNDEELRDYLVASYRLVVAGLTRKPRSEFELGEGYLK